MKKKLLTVMTILAAAASCTVEPDFGLPEAPGDADIRVSCHAELPPTRSACLQGESEIVDWNLYAYHNGLLYAAVYSDSIDVIRLRLGREYKFYVLANTGRVEAPAYESDIASMRFTMSGLGGFSSRGLPMYFKSVLPQTVSLASEQLDFALTRLVARYDVRIDDSALSRMRFSLSSMKLSQAPLDITPFSPRSAATLAGDCDYASAADVDSLNAGGTVSLYMLENCQGVLGGGNTDEWQKYPDETDVSEDLSTYLEVSGTISSVGYSADVSYRMFLGRDNVADFNVFRNTVNTLVLSLTDTGSFRPSWKVALSNVSDSRTVSFRNSKTYAYSDHTGVGLLVDSSPYGVQYYYEADPEEMAAGDFSFTNELMYSQAEIGRGKYENLMPLVKCTHTGSDRPSMKVRLYTWDGIYRGETTVEYEPDYYYHLDLLPQSCTVPVGTTLNISYVPVPVQDYTGSDILITSSNYSTTNASTSVGSGMLKVQGLRVGTAVLTVRFKGTPQTIRVTVI